MKYYLNKMFSAQILRRPGGQVRRTIGSLPKSLTIAMLIAEAVRLGFGYRIIHDQFVAYR